MNWLAQLGRNLGLMVHNIKHPSAQGQNQARHQTISHTVEEKKLDETTTLRRTTIEEIEFIQPASTKTNPPQDDAPRQS
jgi:hypothetical protein